MLIGSISIKRRVCIYNRIFNFSAGPAVLPETVLEKARDDLLNWKQTGMSVMEMSHRSTYFSSIKNHAENMLRSVLGVPDNYAILFLQGGASLQFSMVPLNLHEPGKVMNIINTGSWTQKALAEMKKIGDCHVAATSASSHFMGLPTRDELTLSKRPSFIYMATNNTIFGTQWTEIPRCNEIPLIADMSSDLLSRVIDINQFGLVFAGAQKNIGPSGVTLVIIRQDLADRCREHVPTMLQYRTHIKHHSLYNTPPTFGIYMMGLVLDWIHEQGGLLNIEKKNKEKAKVLYDAIDKSPFFYCPVRKSDRSFMNVVFRVKDNHVELEEQFSKEAQEVGLHGLKGHRSVGGLRASIYNAQPLIGVLALVDFMLKFERQYRVD